MVKITKKYDCIIVGGGMAGLTGAIALTEKGKSVCILERQDRPGKKLLLTGNGKCNITNINMSGNHYLTDDYDRLNKVLDYFDIEKELAFYKRLGMYLKDKNGYVYPVSNQAATVPAVMLRRLKGRADIVNDAFVTDISKKDEGFEIYFKKDGKSEKLICDKVIVATGGKAGVYKEAENNGYRILKNLGHSIRPVYPGLVQTICNEDKGFFKEVSGVRTDAKLSLYIDGKNIASDTGELQLTDKGLSGIPVFQLSRYMGEAISKKKVTVNVDYIPYIDARELKEDILNRYRENMDSRLETEKVFEGIVNKKLLSALLKKARLSPTRTLSAGLEERLERFITLLKDDKIEISELNGFEKAQISTGGIPLSEVTDTLESTKISGLYLCGEVLNVSGECGGYNLHFAAASALLIAGNI